MEMCMDWQCFNMRHTQKIIFKKAAVIFNYFKVRFTNVHSFLLQQIYNLCEGP